MELRSLIEKHSKFANLDPDLIERMVMAESGGNPEAISSAGAQGLMQIMPGTAKELGLKNPLNPEENIEAGIKYFADLQKQFGGDTRKALAAYNWGLSKVKKDPNLIEAPKETHDYIKKIIGTAGIIDPDTLGKKPEIIDPDSMTFDDIPVFDSSPIKDLAKNYLKGLGFVTRGIPGIGPATVAIAKAPGAIKEEAKEIGMAHLIDSFKAGYQSSVVGLTYRGELPQPASIDMQNKYNRIASLAGSILPDVPIFAYGAMIGGAAGGPAAPLTAMGGAFALDQGLRKVLMDKYEKGEVKSFADFWSRLTGAVYETLKGEALGLTVGKVGKMPLGLAKTPAEITALVGTGAALEGRIPEPEDFMDAAVLIGGVKLGTNIAGKLMRVYTETGVKPDQVIRDIATDPTIKEDLVTDKKPIPEAYRDKIQPGPEIEKPKAKESVQTPTPTQPWEMTKEEWKYDQGIEEPSAYLYHGTPEKNLDNIRKNGLESQTRQRNDWEEGDKGPSKQELLYFENKENQNWGGKKSTQLRINEDMLPKGVDVAPDQMRPGEVYTYHNKNEFYTIPPEAIEYYDTKTKQWEPLIDDAHALSIKQALSEGKPVLPEVLKDYPGLQKNIGMEAASPAQVTEGLERFYQEGLQRIEVVGQKGTIELPVFKMPEFKLVEKLKDSYNKLISDFDTLRFFPKMSTEFKNDVRLGVVGAIDTARDKVEKISVAVWGGLKKEDIKQSISVIFARDQVSRVKEGKGNPDISLKEAEEILMREEMNATKDTLQAAERYREIMKGYQQRLVDRGLLDSDQLIEDYAPHYTIDYTPDWHFNIGIPTKLKRPWRGYTKKAKGSTKEYKQDIEALEGNFLKIEHDNLIEDFIINQTKKYDLLPSLSKEQKAQYFGTDKAERAKRPKPGRLYEIDGKKYWGYSPDMPFSRQLFRAETEAGQQVTAMGGFKNVSLLPEDIYKTLRNFSEPGSRGFYWLNRITSYFKSMAILSNFVSFTRNNILGDCYMAMLQHPDKLSFMKEYPTTFKYLLNKWDTPYFKELDTFVKRNQITSSTFIHSELVNLSRAKDPLRYLLDKLHGFSNFRENINRVNYASTLLKAKLDGKGKEMVKTHDWINTEGLSVDAALGKIARDVEVDYSWVSKGFRKYIRGFTFPFGTWYFKMTSQFWHYAGKHPLQALAGGLLPPVLASLYNYSNEEKRELEENLPEDIRNQTHFVLNKNPDGSTNVLSLQLPTDVLIGTKIFSIATAYSARVFNKELTAKEAAEKAFKEWGMAEAKGIVYLTTPFVRFIQGLASPNHIDPFDRSPIYSTDPRYLSDWRKGKEQAMFFFKCLVPYLSVSIQAYQKGLPQDIAVKKVVDKFAGKNALGIYKVWPNAQIEIDGKKWDWDDKKKIDNLYIKSMENVSDMIDDFVASGQEKMDFIESATAKQHLIKVYDMWAKESPELTQETDSNEKAEFIKNALGKSISSRMDDPTTLRKWYQVQLERSETDEEKTFYGEKYQEMRNMSLFQSLKKTPLTTRQLYYMKKLREESELPWGSILEGGNEP